MYQPPWAWTRALSATRDRGIDPSVLSDPRTAPRHHPRAREPSHGRRSTRYTPVHGPHTPLSKRDGLLCTYPTSTVCSSPSLHPPSDARSDPLPGFPAHPESICPLAQGPTDRPSACPVPQFPPSPGQRPGRLYLATLLTPLTLLHLARRPWLPPNSTTHCAIPPQRAFRTV